MSALGARARIGLGTNRLTDSREHIAFVQEAVAAGVGMIDTAHLYSGGRSEAAIGAALSPRPEGVVVATKGGYVDGRPDVFAREIEASLRRLRTDTIDLYYLHRVDRRTPIEESVGAIGEHQERGSIRHVGLSNVSVEQIERARRVVEVAAVQNEYNLAEREHDDVVDYCTEHGIAFVAYYPLRGLGRTPPRDALAWLLQRSPVMLPIPGTLSLEHLRENLAVAQRPAARSHMRR